MNIATFLHLRYIKLITIIIFGILALLLYQSVYEKETGISSVITRGPYLQMASSEGITIRWRTNLPTTSRIKYGEDLNNLSRYVDKNDLQKEHEIRISKLKSETKYYYSVGTINQILAGGDSEHYFMTYPKKAVRNTRIWVLGDSGRANAAAKAVRDAYKNKHNVKEPFLWIMLGDNAYQAGEDSEYQAAVFDMYPNILKNTVLWPTRGNHDEYSEKSQSIPYYDIFTLPTKAEAGGIASGTEAYYSFDYGNIHIVSLDSYISDKSKTGPMMTWLDNDLKNTKADWIIAFWHHPPYTKGHHDSDLELESIHMRENALPILESHGVDVVLSGHSHTYERSYLINKHYGDSTTFESSMIISSGNGNAEGDGVYQKPAYGKFPHEGTVYIVAGSSGKTSKRLPRDHPAIFKSLKELGSVVLKICGNKLEAEFLNSIGKISDSFTIIKGDLPICEIQSN